MKNKVVSLKKRRRKKKFKKVLEKKNYFFIFLGIPLIVSVALTVDNYYVRRYKLKNNLEYNPYMNVDIDYILNNNYREDIKNLKESIFK